MLETSWQPLTVLSLALIFQFVTTEGVLDIQSSSGCTINMTYFKRVDDRLPLLLNYDENLEQYNYVYPDQMNTVNLETEDTLTLACPGSSFLTDGVCDIQQIMCSGNNKFVSDEGIRRFPYFICQTLPAYSMKKNGTCLGDENMLYQVGFRLSDGNFVKLYDVCFDQYNYTALYTEHEITPAIGQASKEDDSIEFDDDNNALFQDLWPAHAYSLANQLGNMMAGINASQLTNISFPGRYLVKTLMSPDLDFTYRSQRVAANNYANAAPQWASIKKGNWRILEDAIKELAVSRDTSITVYTGVYGVLHVAGNPMYLTHTSSGRRAMPVPSVFWKVVLDKRADEAVAFVVSNDPTVDYSDINTTQFCSPDVCESLTWVWFEKESRAQGVITCCHIKSFNNRYKDTPEILANNLLT